MTEPTTPVVSAARREQVARALCALIDLEFDDEDTDQEACLKDTDAFLAVVLPDRDALTLALVRLATAIYDDGMHGRAVPSCAANLDHVLSLVYGDDDAQAGEQEGSEHED